MTKMAGYCFLMSIIVVSTACRKRANDYFPVASGKSWKYGVTAQGAGGTQSGIVTISTMPSRKLGNKNVVPRQIHFGDHSTFDFIATDDSGVYTMAEQNSGDPDPKIKNSPDYLFESPIKVGTTWEGEDEVGEDEAFLTSIPVKKKCSVESLDETVTVPAGTYSHVMKVSCKGSGKKEMPMQGLVYGTLEITSWFAPGTGLVREMKKDLMDRRAFLVGTLYQMQVDIQLESFH